MTRDLRNPMFCQIWPKRWRRSHSLTPFASSQIWQQGNHWQVSQRTCTRNYAPNRMPFRLFNFFPHKDSHVLRPSCHNITYSYRGTPFYGFSTAQVYLTSGLTKSHIVRGDGWPIKFRVVSNTTALKITQEFRFASARYDFPPLWTVRSRHVQNQT
jgi:hypothetical protein